VFLREKKVRSIGDLINNLKKDLIDFKEPVWFRGQSNAKWGLIPTIERIKKPKSESYFTKKFKQNATMLISPRPNSSLEWLLIMQHYGVPTRLLDWTEGPLVAIYFVCVEENNKNEDGALWILRPIELNKIGGIKPEYPFEIPSIEDDVLDTYKPESMSSDRTSMRTPVATLAPRNNTRMQAQLGTFTINHRDSTPIEKLGDKKHIGKYLIPKESKKLIIEELKIISYTKFQLFPELASIGEVIKGDM